MTKQITKLNYKNREFTIVYDGTYYLAIENKYIDKDGKLTKTLNGGEMHANHDINEVIRQTMFFVDIDELEALGMDRVQATIQVYKTRKEER